MTKAAIFDMDGLLINSEPFWQQAEIDIFSKVNITLTKEMCMETMGLRIDEVVTHWHSKYPWDSISISELQELIIRRVIDYIIAEGQAMEGVFETLDLLKSLEYKLALASSSHFRIIHTVVDKLKIGSYFDILHSAELEEYGKPHPAIYISTAKSLGIPPVSCIAFEDSFNGLLAAKAARMKAVAIPDPIHIHETRFDIADLKLSSLSFFNKESLSVLHQ